MSLLTKVSDIYLVDAPEFMYLNSAKVRIESLQFNIKLLASKTLAYTDLNIQSPLQLFQAWFWSFYHTV